MKKSIFLFSGLLFFQQTVAQSQVKYCATMEHMEDLKNKNPDLERQLEANEQSIQDWIQNHPNWNQQEIVYNIPVVVHVVYNNASQNISDAQILSQIVALNEDWSRTNADTVNTPAAFQGVAAASNYQFCMAKRDPSGNPTNGIERRATSVSSFSTNDNVKSYSTGGLNSWDVETYMNIWVCNLGGGVLGYGEFPTSNPSSTFGVVVQYNAFGTVGNLLGGYDLGRITTHEISHCFNLRHIWADDGGACTGTDYVSDTPNQGGENFGCFTFPLTDNCTSTGNGVMFMNYMDYTDDYCKNMFTQGQVNRINASVNLFYPSLLTSDGCDEVVFASDAGITQVVSPAKIVCDAVVIPEVTLKNFGSSNLTSVVINYKVDGGTATTFNWSGNLAPLSTTNVTLPSVTLTSGSHTIKSYGTSPNGIVDPNHYNDTTSYTFNITLVGQNPPINQGFQNINFPVGGWSISNPDNNITWERQNLANHTTSFSIEMRNYDYTAVGAVDDLYMPNLNFTNSTLIPLLKFWVGYATRTTADSDTLEVLASGDCGDTWTSVYKKWGSALSTAPSTTASFVPTSAQWRQELVDLSAFSSSDNMMVIFRNINSNENNLFIDDVNLDFTTGIIESLEGAVVTIYPNPTSGLLTMNTSSLKQGEIKIAITDAIGKVVLTRSAIMPLDHILLDLHSFANGAYLIRVDDGMSSFNQKIIIGR